MSPPYGCSHHPSKVEWILDKLCTTKTDLNISLRPRSDCTEVRDGIGTYISVLITADGGLGLGALAAGLYSRNHPISHLQYEEVKVRGAKSWQVPYRRHSRCYKILCRPRYSSMALRCYRRYWSGQDWLVVAASSASALGQ